MHHFKKIYPILITIFLILLLYILSRSVPEESIRTFLIRLGLAAPIIFIFLKLMTLVVAPLSGTPLLFAGFYAFGPKVVFLTAIATFVSYIINFWISRKWGRDLVGKFVGIKNLARVDKLTENYGLWMLLALRIFEGSVSDFVSYASGLTSMRFSSYMIISTLALIPGTILWYLISLKVTSPLAFTTLSLVLTFSFSTIFILASILFKRWRHN